MGGVWAVPLSTVDLITHRLTPGYESMAFGVYLNSVTQDGPLVQIVLYLHDPNSEASPKAISERTSYLQVRLEFSPLSTPHPSNFQLTRVRSSSAFYRTFNLDMDRSPGFGSITSYSKRPFQTRFRYGSDFLVLTLHGIITRRFILQKARHHALTRSDLL